MLTLASGGRVMAWLCMTGLVLVLSLTNARADDRAKQRAEARIFTQMEKYEAWQEEVESELEELWRHTDTGPYSKQFSAQWKKVDMTQGKGSPHPLAYQSGL